ncbi:enoyl-[acyl-carrier-protein] reductase, mitochondrial [Tanacetum coccineum]
MWAPPSRSGKYPWRAFPFNLSRATCRPGLVSPATSRPGRLGFVAGDSGKCFSVPTVGGHEGVGEVQYVGSAVQGLAPGDLVMASPPSPATPVEYAATVTINPLTALRMMEDDTYPCLVTK